jgi:asparagine synthetase B (glutamine-hydrolysing)
METWDQLGSKFGIDYTYPYLDQRIVEFGLSIPSTLYFKHGQSRYLYKKAIQDFMPEALHKKIKSQETIRAKQLIREGASALHDPQVLDMIAASDSPYIDTHILIKQCREIDTLDLNHLETSIPIIRSLIQATMMLNINKKNL